MKYEFVAVWVGQMHAVGQVGDSGRTERDQSFRIPVEVGGDQVEALPVPSARGVGRPSGPRIPRDLGATERRLDCDLLLVVPHQRPAQRVAPEQPDVSGSVTSDLAEIAG